MSAALTALTALSARLEVPVAPDADEARQWAERELARPDYAAATPTPLDRIAQAIGDFIESILSPQSTSALGNGVLIVVAAVVVALIVTAFVIWGRPRAVRRADAAFAPLFGDDETRSAAELRRDADAAARDGDWSQAIVLRTRAIARALQQRGLVDPAPGATVHAFARQAAHVFPDDRALLEATADAFDDVRYLRRPGTSAAYARIAAADDRLAAAHPQPRVTARDGVPA